MSQYTYHIDLNERGYFMAHVENTRGRVVVSWNLPAWYCVECGNDAKNCTCENQEENNLQENWDILDSDWGIMRHNEDVDGLGAHLRECGIIPQNADLVLVK